MGQAKPVRTCSLEAASCSGWRRTSGPRVSEAPGRTCPIVMPPFCSVRCRPRRRKVAAPRKVLLLVDSTSIFLSLLHGSVAQKLRSGCNWDESEVIGRKKFQVEMETRFCRLLSCGRSTRLEDYVVGPVLGIKTFYISLFHFLSFFLSLSIYLTLHLSHNLYPSFSVRPCVVLFVSLSVTDSLSKSTSISRSFSISQ